MPCPLGSCEDSEPMSRHLAVLLRVLMLAIAVTPSACVVGRIGRAWEHAGSAEEARAIASHIELPGRVVEEGSFGRCGVNHGKWHDWYRCWSYVARFTVVSGMDKSAWLQFNQQLILNGWKHLGNIFTRADFEGEVHIAVNPQPFMRRTPYEKRVAELMNGLTSDELLLGLFVLYQTPTDVLRSHDCYLFFPCLPYL